jgi:hypothetical protein
MHESVALALAHQHAAVAAPPPVGHANEFASQAAATAPLLDVVNCTVQRITCNLQPNQ